MAVASATWDLTPGDALPRRELRARYGGRLQGGMTTSRTSPNLFLFTEPRGGERHGYFGGWDGPHFHYTGMGQAGDQEMRDANRALRDHDTLGLSVRLFRATGPTVTYLGCLLAERLGIELRHVGSRHRLTFTRGRGRLRLPGAWLRIAVLR